MSVFLPADQANVAEGRRRGALLQRGVAAEGRRCRFAAAEEKFAGEEITRAQICRRENRFRTENKILQGFEGRMAFVLLCSFLKHG